MENFILRTTITFLDGITPQQAIESINDKIKPLIVNPNKFYEFSECSGNIEINFNAESSIEALEIVEDIYEKNNFFGSECFDLIIDNFNQTSIYTEADLYNHKHLVNYAKNNGYSGDNNQTLIEWFKSKGIIIQTKKGSNIYYIENVTIDNINVLRQGDEFHDFLTNDEALKYGLRIIYHALKTNGRI